MTTEDQAADPRDELAALIHQTDCPCDEPPYEVDYRMADAILARWQLITKGSLTRTGRKIGTQPPVNRTTNR